MAQPLNAEAPASGLSELNAGLGGILTCTTCGGVAKLQQDRDRVFGGHFIKCQNTSCRLSIPLWHIVRDARRYRWLRDADRWPEEVQVALMDCIGLDEAVDDAMTPND